jgi:hypothetical protein
VAFHILRQLLDAKHGKSCITKATEPECEGCCGALDPIYIRLGSPGDTACQVLDSLGKGNDDAF